MAELYQSGSNSGNLLLRAIVSNFLGCIIRRGNKIKARNLFLVSMKLIRDKFHTINKSSLILGKGKSSRSSSRLKKAALLQYYRYKMLFPYFVLVGAVLKAAPRVTLRSKRVGGVIYRLPKPINKSSYSYSMGVRALVKNARLRKEPGYSVRLANEIIETYKGKSPTLKKKDEMYKVAFLNRPFVRYLRRRSGRH